MQQVQDQEQERESIERVRAAWWIVKDDTVTTLPNVKQ